MAKTKVLTITIQNQPGALAAVAKALGSAKVNILALSGTAQGAAGTVHLAGRRRQASKEDPRRSQACIPGDWGGTTRAGEQARCAGAALGEARSKRCQSELDPCHGREGREKGGCGLHRRGPGQSQRGTSHGSARIAPLDATPRMLLSDGPKTPPIQPRTPARVRREGILFTLCPVDGSLSSAKIRDGLRCKGYTPAA